MKIKALLVGSIIVLIVFLVYLTTLDKKVYYLSLGDALATGTTPYGNNDYGYSDYIKDYLKEKKVLEKYVTEFSDNNFRTTDLLRIINDNKKVVINNKKQTIKNALIKADLITVSIGYNDLLSKIGFNEPNKNDLLNYVDEIMEDVDELFYNIREYCKEDVLIIGYYVPVLYKNDQTVNEYIEYANDKLKILSERYEMNYININDTVLENEDIFTNPLSSFPNKKGYQLIAEEIKKCINDVLF